MKKYIIFAISFLVLFIGFEVIAGMFLAFMYTPNVNEAWSMSGRLSQETILTTTNNQFLFTLMIAFLAASIAYFIPKKIGKVK